MSRLQLWLGHMALRTATAFTALRRLAPAASAEERLKARIRARIRRLGRIYEDGNSDLVGYTYHPIYYKGFGSVPAHRSECDARLAAIMHDLHPQPGDWVLDVGANVGYFAFGLAQAGARVEAWEVESDTFEIGAALARLHQADVLYVNQGLSRRTLRLLRPRYRAVLVLSVFHWIVKQEGADDAIAVLRDLMDCAERLYFEVPCYAADAQFKHPWFASRHSLAAFFEEALPEFTVVPLLEDARWMDRVLWRITRP
jgi:SAM-dependent methyltransferase